MQILHDYQVGAPGLLSDAVHSPNPSHGKSGAQDRIPTFYLATTHDSVGMFTLSDALRITTL